MAMPSLARIARTPSIANFVDSSKARPIASSSVGGSSTVIQSEEMDIIADKGTSFTSV